MTERVRLIELDFCETISHLLQDLSVDSYTINYVCSRVKNEGIRFLTITLPKLSRAVLKGLQTGFFDRSELTSFAWKYEQSLRVFPKFLEAIFDVHTGHLVEVPDSYAVMAIRQACDYLYKLAIEFTEEQLRDAESTFVATDNEVLQVDSYERSKYVESLRAFFECNYRFRVNTLDVLFKNHIPRPGPGTFSGVHQYQKDTSLPWYTRKDRDWSIDSRFKDFSWSSRPVKYVPTHVDPTSSTMCSEVLFVPKDSRGPRTIVREPFSLLKAQMSFNEWLSDEINRISFRRVNFKSQQVNRELAKLGSCNGAWATLDLKDASDRVSYNLCQRLFRNNPVISRFLRESTRMARLPSGTLHPLKKVAGMGSGLTFPLMSLLIHLSITYALCKRRRMTFNEAAKLVYVYGDDIIVPTWAVTIANKALDSVGLRVNIDKSFSAGPFRESCGGDFFKGQDVGPVRLKLMGPRIELSRYGRALRIYGSHGLLALERHARQLVLAGLTSTADYLYHHIERHVGKLPLGTGETPALVRYVGQLSEESYSTDSFGNFEPLRVLVPVPVSSKYDIDPFIALSRALRRVEVSESCSKNPLEAFVPRKVSLKRVKVSSFRLLG